ncbi:MAG: Lpg1974 family pore-forming outer membrane protein [Chlamydiota bacterium]
MKKYTIGISSLLALSCIGSSSLRADVSDAQMRSLENRVNTLEQKKSATNALNPSGRPQVRDGADLFFTADWLIWQAHENGLGYAVKAQTPQPVESALYRSSVKNMEFDWDFGFRLGLGWNTPHDGWDLGINWTWFQDKAKQTLTADADHILLPTTTYNPADATLEGFRSAASKWRLHLNLLDLDLGREFFVSKWMTLRPFISLRSGWIFQNMHVNYSKGTPSVAQTGAFFEGKSNFWGIGPRMGLNTQWGLGHGISLFGNAGASLLYGFFNLSSYQNQLFTGSSNDVVSNTDSVRVGRAISELALGVRWDSMFANDRCHFGIQGGWEHLMFFEQNQFKHFTGSSSASAGSFVSNQGDLTIQGWTISARLDF